MLRLKGCKQTRKVFYGWWIVAAGFCLIGLDSGLLSQAFGIYFVRLQTEFGWSRTTLSGAYSLVRVESGILGPLQGWLTDKLGSRVVASAGLVLFAIGYFLLSHAGSVLAFFAALFLVSVGDSLFSFLTISAALANWFHRKRATAMGLASAGAGLGGLLVLSVAWWTGRFGWRETAIYSAILALVVGLPVAQLMRHRPESYGYLPDGAPVSDQRAGNVGQAAREASVVRNDVSTDGFTARQALRTSAFWLLALGHASAVTAVSAVNVHLVPHLVQKLELSIRGAAGVVAVLTVFMVFGMVGGGLLGDRIDKRAIAVVCMLGHTVALVVLALAPSLTFVFAFAVLHGLAWGTRGPLMSAMRADYFGRKAFATIMGFSSLIVLVAGMAGVLFAGVLADLTGGYELGFLVLAAVTGLGSFFLVAVRKPTLSRLASL